MQNSLNSPFHSIKQILEFFVKHDNLISVQSYAIPILQCHPPHVCYTWHGKLLVAKGVPNYKKKFKNTCSLHGSHEPELRTTPHIATVCLTCPSARQQKIMYSIELQYIS